MNAGRVFRVETAQLLKAAAGAGFEAIEPNANRMLDGGIITNVEVQEWMFLGAAPVAPLHRLVVAHVEGAGDDLAIALGEHETEIGGEAFVQFVEKLLGQILPAIVKPVDMAFV